MISTPRIARTLPESPVSQSTPAVDLSSHPTALDSRFRDDGPVPPTLTNALAARMAAEERTLLLDAERELMQAIEAYKLSSGRMFPTWSEVLEVLRDLGYEKSV